MASLCVPPTFARRALRIGNNNTLRHQVLRAVALSVLTRYWRRIPYVRTLAAPVMLFFAAERLLGTKQAAMLGGLALWQPLVPWILYGLDLWRTRSELLMSWYHADRAVLQLRTAAEHYISVCAQPLCGP